MCRAALPMARHHPAVVDLGGVVLDPGIGGLIARASDMGKLCQLVGLTLPLSGRLRACGVEAESLRWPVPSRGWLAGPLRSRKQLL